MGRITDRTGVAMGLMIIEAGGKRIEIHCNSLSILCMLESFHTETFT